MELAGLGKVVGVILVIAIAWWLLEGRRRNERRDDHDKD